jgi:Tfp pilus assembly protein PilF
MIDRFGQPGIRVALAFILIIALHPTPIPQPLTSALQAVQVALDHNRPEAGLESLERALAFEPAIASLRLLAAEIALTTGDYPRVFTHLDLRDPLDETNLLPNCVRSHALLAIGDMAKALETWRPIQDACPQPASFFRALAEMSLTNVDRQTTMYALEQLTALEPNDPLSQLTYGQLLATHHPKDSLPFLRRARALSSEAGWRASPLISTIEEALLIDQEAYTLAQVGQNFAKQGEWRLATWSFESALKIEPTYVEVRAFYGLARDQVGEDGSAELQRAIEETPNAALPHIFLALHWLQASQPERARPELEFAATLDPENPAIAAELGAAYALLGDIEAAKAAYLHATQIAPKDPRFWITLAQFSLNHEIEIATLGLPAARNAVALTPEDPAAWDFLGYAHTLLNNPLLAERTLWKAINLQPTRAATQFHLGLFHQIQGDTSRAYAAFEMAALLDPDGVIGQMAEGALDRFR